ncbi:HIT family protein [Psychrobacter cibarius]|nr:HIT family protein [Psychrobacter cibarius]
MSQYHKNGCVFCDHSKIQAGDIREHHLRGVDFLSFTPLNPIALGHLVVIPVPHVDDASAAPDITGATFELASMIAKDRGLDSYNLIVNKGAYADQTVFHLHVHIIPRFKGDETITVWNTNEALQGRSEFTDRRDRPAIFRRT